MSNWYTNLVPCPDIQVMLKDSFEAYNASTLRDETPFFDYVNSNTNRSGVAFQVAPGKDKIKVVDALYEQRLTASAAGNRNSNTRVCTAVTTRGDLTASYTIDPSQMLFVEELLAEYSFTYVCENIENIINRKINLLINGLMLKVAQTVTNQALLLLSSNWSSDLGTANWTMVNGAMAAKVPTLQSGGVLVDPLGYAKLTKYLMQSNFGPTSPIFTTGLLYDYFLAMKAGCCSTSGIALDQIMSQHGIAVAYDRLVGASMTGSYVASTDAWVMRPGALQIITYNRNDNGLKEAAGITYGTTYQKQIIYDPRTGFPIDLTLSETCNGVSIILEANPKCVSMPSDMFPIGDHMQGENFFNLIRVTNP